MKYILLIVHPICKYTTHTKTEAYTYTQYYNRRCHRRRISWHATAHYAVADSSINI